MSAVIESPSLGYGPSLDGLTIKQRLFVEAYVQTRNGTESARQAGYKGPDPSLAQMAYENLRKPEIVSAIQARFAAFHVTSDEVLSELSKIARYPLEKCTEGPVKTNDKLKALDLAGKYFGMWDKPAENDVSASEVASELFILLKSAAENLRASRLEPGVIDVSAEVSSD